MVRCWHTDFQSPELRLGIVHMPEGFMKGFSRFLAVTSRRAPPAPGTASIRFP